uniref:YbjN domain-containing protein n=1 Tax=Amphora coffeiformis TaxID=265554 RepID=A0A7S3L478_9STRA
MSELILNANIQVTEDESSGAMGAKQSIPTDNQVETETPEGFAEATSVDPVVDATVVDEASTTPSSHQVEASPVAVLHDSKPRQLIETCREFLDREGLTYDTHSTKEEATVLTMFLTGKSASFKTYLEVREDQKRVFTYVESPIKVPAMKRSAAAEFLMRCNYSMALGNFEVDFRDGEVRFRNGIDVEGGVLSVEMVRQLILLSAATMDRFFGGLMQVVYGSLVPLEAFEECCNPPAKPVENLQ